MRVLPVRAWRSTAAMLTGRLRSETRPPRERMPRSFVSRKRGRTARELALDDEKILVFDDLRVDKSGHIAKFGGLMDRPNGGKGNVCLINGRS